ncbi:hypothetical protein [Microbacterium sp. TPD7012]|uniref:hypothetical protein n=1 Tax=Microbacterium sp. TPD7012 TaxID=2171975 RepID=UPI000D51F4E2|nr:hypothetical protein [Microbacterium sp. TPD7012]PVE97100.1 hypothetical protein DC434_06880 [Microbacterium sp. TPD7012]
MTRIGELPPSLGQHFSVSTAREEGVLRSRLRASDLESPFRGTRRRASALETTDAATDIGPMTGPHRAEQLQRRAGAHGYAPRMHPEHFFALETAAALWGAPLPLFRRLGEDDEELPVHVGVFGTGSLPRLAGVTGHRMRPATTAVCTLEGLRVTTPASTWASLGTLPLHDLVALGDYFCRVWRPGYGRPRTDRQPLTTPARLRAATASGRRVGVRRLREALALVRTDSWSPRESKVRCILVEAGLAEPELNIDVFDDDGRFLGCADMAYPRRKVAVEYHGIWHSSTYARDVERIARLRAAGWTVIEVTADLVRRPADLVSRVRQALG